MVILLTNHVALWRRNPYQSIHAVKPRMVCLHLLLFYSFPSLLAACPFGSVYNAQLNKCYTLVDDPQTFPDAEKACMAGAGHLISIRNGFETALINGKLAIPTKLN